MLRNGIRSKPSPGREVQKTWPGEVLSTLTPEGSISRAEGRGRRKNDYVNPEVAMPGAFKNLKFGKAGAYIGAEELARDEAGAGAASWS